MPTLPQVSRLSLKTILLPTDFSSASQMALPFARSLARVYGSTVFVAHSIAPEPHPQIVTDRIPEQDNVAWEEARHKLDAFTENCSADSGNWKSVLQRGDLADVIPALIQENHIDLVVLGTHGRRGVTKLILGSAAERIYRSAPCPVLTVGPKAQQCAADKEWTARRILCPVDVADDLEPVMHYALALAEENQAELIVLEAVPLVPWQHRPSVEERSRHALEYLIPEDANDWCAPRIVIRWEHPVEAILSESQEAKADVIVMSVHKSRAATLSAHLPWPIASDVVSRAPCPVLTIRV
jgi:nucleotide-binding universal stress UspA family protein